MIKKLIPKTNFKENLIEINTAKNLLRKIKFIIKEKNIKIELHYIFIFEFKTLIFKLIN